ncbi:hypothetical protein CQW23_32575 [Capsicum baccatum]|uniref:FF domain-containing protein n=1 Tax=Capsicum baccatum TaxID=33114 RepID=A0A2G2V4B0_CAPBA|nr:hypothetical protein CQW23_32575 [Capsicum baccatum]
MMVDNVLVVNGDAVSCDGGIVISTDTVATVADGGGRGGNAGDSSGDGVRRMCGMVVLVLIDELVSSGDRPVAFDGGAVGGRGIHGSIWYLDDKSHIKHAVRMAEVITTLHFNLCCASVAIAKYISSPPMSDTNLKVLHKISELSAKAFVVLPCYVSLEVDKFIIAKLATRRYYYNKVTRTSKWRMPDEAKVMLDLNPIWLACEKETISHASDFRSISVVKTLSPGADGSLVLAHGAKSSPIAMSPDANLPTIVASESSSLSGKVSSPMIEIVKMKNSSEPSSIVVASSEKIGIAVTLGNSLAPPVSETTTTQDAIVYGDGFSSENREEAKSAFKTLLEYANIGSDCTWDQAMRAVINDRRYGALKSLCEQKQAFNGDCKELSPSSRESMVISIFEHDEHFKAIERAKDCEELFEDYVEELEKKEHAKALEEQKRNRVECLEFLKSHDFIKEYIRDLESEWEKKRKLWMEELRKAEHKNHDEFRKLMEEHVATGILNAKTNRRDYCIKIKSFVAYLAVSSNTSGSTGKDLYTDVMDELEK